MIPTAPNEKPKFASDFPDDPELDRLVDAFVRGNHHFVRQNALLLADKTENPQVARAARELRKRLDPDPIAYVLLTTTAVLLITLTLWAIHQSRRYDSTRPSSPPKTVQIVK